MRVLVTGGSGYVGRKVVAALAQRSAEIEAVVSTDVRDVAPSDRLDGVTYAAIDIRSPDLPALIARHRPDVIVHLASVVTPPKGMTEKTQREIDVDGTRAVLDAALAAGTQRIIVTSSGAAYGYSADNAPLLTEDMPLRGHPEFAYSIHKREIEEMLARYRKEHPGLGQLVLRLSTVLGEHTKNQITDLFEKQVVIGVKESSAPFTIIWDEDVVACIVEATFKGWSGVYNLTGDGVITLREIAAEMGSRYLPLPERWLARGLDLLHKRGLTQYGPEQVDFLRYRPVMSAEKIKRELGFIPRKTTREVFAMWKGAHARHKRQALSEPQPAGKKVVVITGAAGGIGRALTERFLQGGARVALVDRDQPAVERLRAELSARGADCIAIPCDVTDEAACQEAITKVRSTWGRIDVLINNAGIAHRSLLAETSATVIERVMAVNFFGAVHMTQAALPDLISSRGVVAAISSVAGFAPLVGRTGYAASKHALHGFFDSLRAEVGARGVGVLIACPSYVDTAMDQRTFEAGGSTAVKKAAVGKLLAPEDVADRIFDAVKSRERMVVLSPIGKASYWLSRLSPPAYELAMKRSVRDEFPQI